MTFTYTDDPANNDRDAVRLLSGDTDSSEFFLSDAEVDYAISKESNITAAAARACEMIAAKMAREVALRAGASGELRLELQQIFEAYTQRAKELRREAIANAVPYAASISTSEKNDQLDDSDRVSPFFKRNQFKGDATTEKLVIDWNRYGLK